MVMMHQVCTDEHLTVRTHAHIFLRTPHFAQFIPMHLQWLKVFERSLCLSPKSSHPRTMSLLGVPKLSAFPSVLTSSTATPTPLTGIRLNLCTTPLWGGPSGHLAHPTPNTGYEPKFCIDVGSEHTPIFRPERASSSPRMTRQSPLRRTLACLNIQEQAAGHLLARTVPTLWKLGSLGSSSRKLVADAENDTNFPSVEESVSRVKRDPDLSVVQTSKARQNLMVLERQAELAVRGEK